MTAIASIVDENGTIWMGGDSAAVADNHSVARKDRKVFVNGNFIIGFTTSFRMGQLLNYSFIPPEHPKNMSTLKYMSTVFIDAVKECLSNGGYNKGGTFLVGYNKKLFQIESDFQVGIPSFNYGSVGCGYELCLGSLHSTAMDPSLSPKQRLRMALKAAETFSGAVKSPFIIKSLKV